MEGIFESLNSVTGVTNLILTVLFISVFVVFVLGFLRGLLQGWRYGTFRIIFFMILIVAAVLTVKPVTMALGDLDLRSIGIHYSREIQIEVSESFTANIWIEVTTLKDTATNFISQLLRAYNVNADPTKVIEYSFALATSILTIVVLLTEIILIALVGNLVCLLLWNAAFKYLTPKEKRKKKTKRLISGLEQAVTSLVCFCMFLAPLTGVVNAITRNFETLSEDDENYNSVILTNQSLGYLYDVVKTYDDSLFNKAFFSWYVDQNGMTYDTALLNFIGTIEFDEGLSVSFIQELGNIAKMGSYVVNSGLISEEEFRMETLFSFLASESSVKLLDLIGKSTLVQNLAPFALEIVLHSDSIFEYIGTVEGLDIADYDVAQTLNELLGVYNVMRESGVIEEMLDADGKFNIDAAVVKRFFSEDYFSVYDEIVSLFSPEKSALIGDILKSAFYVQVVKEYRQQEESEEGTVVFGLKDFLPPLTEEELKVNSEGTPVKIPDCIKNLDLAKELKVVIDSLLQIINVDSRFLDIIFDPMFDDSEDAGFGDDAIMEIIKLVLDNADEIEHYIDGKPVEGAADVCLFDSELMANAVPGILNVIGSFFNSNLGLTGEKAVSFAEIINDFNSKDSQGKKSFAKEEFRAIFDILDPLLESEEGKALVLDFENMPGIYFAKDGTFLGARNGLLEAFAESVSNIDKSSVLNTALPAIMEGFFEGANGLLAPLGLDITLDYRCIGSDGKPHFGSELARLVLSYSECQEALASLLALTSTTSNLGAIEKTFTELCAYTTSNGGSQIVTLLTTLAESKIFNPTFTEGGSTVYNKNIIELFGTLFTLFGLDSNDIKNEIKDIVMDENFNANAEFTNLIDLVKYLCDSHILESLNSLSFDALGGISFAELFGFVSGSEVLKIVIPNVIDSALSSNAIFTYVDPDGQAIALTFKSIEDWATEGAALDAMMKYALEIGDITNIDLASLNPEMISSIFDCFSNSNLFIRTNSNGTKDFLFPEYLANKLTKIMKTAGPAGTFFTNLEETYEGGVYKVEAADPSLDESYSVVTSELLSHSVKNATSMSEIRAEQEAFGNEGHVLSRVIANLSHSGAMSLVTDGGNANLGGLRIPYFHELVSDISDSMILQKTGLAQLVKIISDALAESNDSFKNVNIMYAYNQTDPVKRQEIVDCINSIVSTVFDPVSGVIKADGLINSSALGGIDSLSANGFISPLLHALNDCKVFTSLSEFQRNTAGINESSFVSLIGNVIKSAGWYGTAEKASAILPHIYDLVEDNGGWSNEIDRFVEVIDDLQVMGLELNADFSFSNFFTDEKYGEDVIADLFIDINESSILYPGFPLKLEESLTTLSVGGLSGSGVDLTKANTFYKGSVLSSVGAYKYANVSYDEEECWRLAEALHHSSDLNGAPFGNILLLDSDLIENLTDLLSVFAKSNIFNTKKPGSSVTVFQESMASLLSEPAMDGYYWSTLSPKDKANLANYVDVESKAHYVSGLYYPVVSVTNSNSDTSNINGEGAESLRTVLKTLIANHDWVDALRNGTVDSLPEAEFSALFKALNHSDWTYDIVPNVFADTVGNNVLLDVELRRANPYYAYDYDIVLSGGTYVNSGTLLGSKNYDNHYEEIEIDYVTAAIYGVKANVNLVSSFSSTSELLAIQNFLLSLDDSYVFHKAGASYDLLTDDSIAFKVNDLSVFEQAMYSLYRNSKLSDLSYDSVYDGEYVDADTKLLDAIRNYPSNLWSNEIVNLIINDSATDGLFYNALSLGLIDSSGNVSVSGSSFTNQNPNDLGELLYATNKSDIACDVVKYQIMSVLDDKVGFKEFSKTNATYSVNANNYELELASPLYALEINMSSGAAPTVSYKVNGETKTIAPTGSNPYVYNFYDGSTITDRPLANAVSISGTGTISNIKASFTVGSALTLTQEEYDTNHEGAINEIIKILDTLLYDSVNDEYINLGGTSTALAEMFLTSGNLTKIAEFVQNEHSLFTKTYDASFKEGALTSFTAADVTMGGILNLRTASGRANLLSYMPRYNEELLQGAYNDIHKIFAEGEVSDVVSWLDANIGKVLGFYVSYSALGNIDSKVLAVADLTVSGQSLGEYLELPSSVAFETFEASFKTGFAMDLYEDMRAGAIDANHFASNISGVPYNVNDTTYADFLKLNRDLVLPLLKYNRVTGLSSGSDNAVLLNQASSYSSSNPLADILVVTFEKAIYEALLANKPTEASAILSSATPFGASGYFKTAAGIVIA